MNLPEKSRSYQNHHLDSTRWDVFVPREDDIVVTTSYKSGTTWTQQILLYMIYGDLDEPPNYRDVSPWIDARFTGCSRRDLAALCEGLERRRFVKSHLPLDGIPYWPQVKYLVVGRDPRDVFMSLFNHYSNYTELAMKALNETPGRVGPALEPCPEDPRALWSDWISRGWFDWESEGYPFWSNLHHVQSYWEFRHLPNFCFLHYDDMLRDLDGEVARIARFLEIELEAKVRSRIVEQTTFASARKRALNEEAESELGNPFFRGGSASFFYKGTNGRWRDVLDADDLALYEAAKERVLSPDCAAWLEAGGRVVDANA